MLSLKRLLAILMVTLLLGIVYFSYTLNESRVRQVELKNNIPAEEVFLKNESWDVTEQTKYLLVGEKSTVRDNAETLLATQKLPYEVREKLGQEDLTRGNILIFCTDTLENCVDVKLLEAYLTRGGKMILASGIAEGYAGGTLTVQDGKGKWVLTDDMAAPEVKEEIKELLGEPDEITLNFKGGRKVRFKISDDGNELTEI